MKTEKKVLIKEDNRLLADILQDLHSFKPTLTALIVTYKELQMGPFTNEIFEVVKLGGLPNIHDKYKANLESELSATGVINPILRKTVLSASEPIFQNFETAYNNLQAFTPATSNYLSRPSLTLNRISYINEKFVVTESDQELLLESHCRVYLQTEEEKSFHLTLHNLTVALNAYLKDFVKYRLDQKVHGYLGLETFLSVEDMAATIKAESIRYGVTVAELEREKHEAFVIESRKRREREAENQRRFNAGELPAQVAWRKLNEVDDLVN